MKINFSKLENYYYYSINRYFWHLLIALSLLVIIGGAVIYIWSYVPPTKEHVEQGPKPQKESYPPLQKVSADEILAALPKKKIKIEEKKEVSSTTEEPELDIDYEKPVKTKQIDSAALQRYYSALAITKNLIPYDENKSFWENRYEYYFPSERDRKLYRKTKNPAFRKRRLVAKGFDIRFNDYAERQGFDTYDEKAQLLEALNKVLEAFDPIYRKEFANYFTTSFPARRYDLRSIENRFDAIAQVLSKIQTKKQWKAYSKLWNFINRNPNDGLPMVLYQGQIVDSIAPGQRLAFMEQMIAEYNRHYNNNLNALIESTDYFLKLLPRMPADNQAEALKIYYHFYRRNNNERLSKIREIDRKYAQDVNEWKQSYYEALRRAENDYLREKRKREDWRGWSVKGILVAFGSVLLLSIILLIISMIRNINRLTEAIYENNQLVANHLEESKSKNITQE